MKKIVLVAALAPLACLTATTAGAQAYVPVHAVQDLPGWQCMALASSYGPNGISAPPAPVFAGPEANAPRVGNGAGVIIVPAQLRPENGRTVMIWPNGRKVWIDVSQLTPWHALSDPSASCRPALMSNGRYGFKTSG